MARTTAKDSARAGEGAPTVASRVLKGARQGWIALILTFTWGVTRVTAVTVTAGVEARAAAAATAVGARDSRPAPQARLVQDAPTEPVPEQAAQVTSTRGEEQPSHSQDESGVRLTLRRRVASVGVRSTTAEVGVYT